MRWWVDTKIKYLNTLQKNIAMKTKKLFLITIILIVICACEKDNDDNDGNILTEISYPIEGKYGINILNDTDSILVPGDYSMAAELRTVATLKVTFNGDREGNLAFEIGQQNTGWEDLDSDETGELRSLKTNRTGSVDMKMMFFEEVTIHIFENGTTEPTRTKILYKQN